MRSFARAHRRGARNTGESPQAAEPGHATPAGIGNRRIQASLAEASAPAVTVSTPGDRDEVAADRAAEQVMRGADVTALPRLDNASGHIQRVSGDISPREEDGEVREGERPAQEASPRKERLQRKAAAGRPRRRTAERVAARVAARKGQGKPLERSVRSFMEARFGHDFSGTRVHEGAEPAAMTKAIAARAFTWRSEVYFAAGEYRPQSEDGRRMIAHELAHVIQQTGFRRPRATAALRGPVRPGAEAAPDGASRSGRTHIARLSAPGRVIAHDVHPWRDEISGTKYEAQTGGGSTVPVWEAYTPWQLRYHYWCHGLSLGTYEDYGYSVYSGTPMAQVIRDEWQPVASASARSGDIAVWTPTFDHSARFTSVATSGGRLDEGASRLDTKNGNQPLKNASLTEIRRDYATISRGSPQVFRRR